MYRCRIGIFSCSSTSRRLRKLSKFRKFRGFGKTRGEKYGEAAGNFFGVFIKAILTTFLLILVYPPSSAEITPFLAATTREFYTQVLTARPYLGDWTA